MNNKAFLAVLVLCISPVTAAKSNLADEIQLCRALKSDTDRLGCYDKLATTVTEATDVIPKLEATPPVVTEQFGLKEKRINEPDHIIATVTRIKKSQFGALTLYLDNAQVWKQSGSSRFFIKVNDKVEVKKAALGSFMMKKVGSNKTIRVKRLK